MSTANHPDTDAPTVFVYDGHPGGAGFAERAYTVAADWLDRHPRRSSRNAAATPAARRCVQSPKCGNGNSPLAKDAAVRVLDLVLSSLAPAT